jgi:four helix bundle protein
MSYKDFSEMPVWKAALELLVRIYDVTSEFPKEEKFGMTSDMRRAANSVTHNIAEGFGRFENKDKTRFYKISRGSCYELMSQTIASHRLGFIKQETLKEELLTRNRSIIDELNAINKTLESSLP